MPISNEEWGSIASMVDRMIDTKAGFRRDYFMVGTVSKRNTKDNVIYVKELGGDVKIPIFTFDYRVVYYDESPRGTAGGGSYRTYKKAAEVTPKLPQIGDEVLIAKEMGNDLLPRCLGVLRSRKYINDLEDT